MLPSALSSGCATLTLSVVSAVLEGSLGLAGNIKNLNLTPLSNQQG